MATDALITFSGRMATRKGHADAPAEKRCMFAKQVEQQKMPLLELPDELVLVIAGHLQLKDMVHMAQSCKRLNAVIWSACVARQVYCDSVLPAEPSATITRLLLDLQDGQLPEGLVEYKNVRALTCWGLDSDRFDQHTMDMMTCFSSLESLELLETLGVHVTAITALRASLRKLVITAAAGEIESQHVCAYKMAKRGRWSELQQLTLECDCRCEYVRDYGAKQNGQFGEAFPQLQKFSCCAPSMQWPVHAVIEQVRTLRWVKLRCEEDVDDGDNNILEILVTLRGAISGEGYEMRRVKLEGFHGVDDDRWEERIENLYGAEIRERCGVEGVIGRVCIARQL